MNLPTDQDISRLHKKYAPSSRVYELVYRHSQIVRDIAMGLVNEHGSVDIELVKVACMLHDLGVYPLFGANGKILPRVNYITHGLEGESILKSEGFPEIIWRFASHHTGVGLTRAYIKKYNLPLPAKDYIAESEEELLVMYADKFHSKTQPPYFNSYEWYKRDVAKFGQDKVATFEQLAGRFGLPDLLSLSQKYGYAIR